MLFTKKFHMIAPFIPKDLHSLLNKKGKIPYTKWGHQASLFLILDEYQQHN